MNEAVKNVVKSEASEVKHAIAESIKETVRREVKKELRRRAIKKVRRVAVIGTVAAAGCIAYINRDKLMKLAGKCTK